MTPDFPQRKSDVTVCEAVGTDCQAGSCCPVLHAADCANTHLLLVAGCPKILMKSRLYLETGTTALLTPNRSIGVTAAVM